MVVHAGLACFAVACAAATQSGREGTSDAAVLNASPTTVRLVLAEDDARRLVSLDKTVSEAREEGRFADAIAPGREVLAIRLKALGEDDQAVENSYNSLASTLEALGRLAEAEPLQREALKIQLKRVRNDDVATIACYLDAIALQHRRGNFAAAKWLTQTALTKCRTIERPDRLETRRY